MISAVPLCVALATRGKLVSYRRCLRMKIAKIVSSNSHIDYVARVLDARDGGVPPRAADHSFGQFVSVAGEDENVIGVIYDSRLVNPEYGSFGPRLAPRAAHVNPDFVQEQGVLLGILLLGVISSDGRSVQGVPPRIVPPGQDVIKIDADVVKRFHTCLLYTSPSPRDS